MVSHILVKVPGALIRPSFKSFILTQDRFGAGVLSTLAPEIGAYIAPFRAVALYVVL